MTGLSLSRVLRDFPDVTLDKVEYLANLGRSRRDGVRGIPTLVAGEQKLSGFLLTAGRMRKFLEAI